MLFVENIRLAFSSLFANKMRAFLTMLGIIIGISSVIAIMTVGNSLTINLSDEMSSMGASNITVYLQTKEEEEDRRSAEEGFEFGSGGISLHQTTEDDLFTREMLTNFTETYADEVVAISASETVNEGQITLGNRYANVSVMGASGGYFLSENVELVAGRFFSSRESTEKKMVGILSDRAVEKLFDGDNDKAIGAMLPLSVGDRYTEVAVVGVYKYEESSFGPMFSGLSEVRTNLYIPLPTAMEMTHTPGYASFTVVADQEVDPDEFVNTIVSFFKPYFRSNRYFGPSAFSMASLVESFTSMMGNLTTAISIIAGIALLVGGIGVMNIMLVSITERTREIGTRKALGAPNSAIRMQFIIEAVVICLVGGAIGVILGIVLGSVASSALLNTPAKPSLFSILLSFGFSAAIGVFFGFYPANKAAKMDPIDALRYE